MVVALLLLLTAGPDTQEPPSATSGDPVSVGNVTFEPADLSVSYQQVVPLGTTYYKTQIMWRFSDGTSIIEPVEDDWFFTNGFSFCCTMLATVPPTLVWSSASRPAHYVRIPKTPAPVGSVLVGADVTVVAAILANGNAFGDAATVRNEFGKRQVLEREYQYWLMVIDQAWQDDSAIATLRTIVPLLQRPRPDPVGERVRQRMKQGADAMLLFAERNLSDSPRLLNALVSAIKQQHMLLVQDRRQRSSPLQTRSGVTER
jgi:hypothetical protein